MEIYNTAIGKFLLNEEDLVSKTLLDRGFWEPELKGIFDRSLTKDSVVVEVGSYIGDHTIYLSERCKHIYAYEGFKRNYYQLCANLLLNNCKNVSASNIAIGNGELIREVDVEDSWNTDWVLNAAGARFIQNSGLYRSYKLDDILHEKISYLKVDAEGMDLHVMRGAKYLIEKYNPIITFEYNPLISMQTYDEYEEFLLSLDYVVERIGEYNWLAQRREDV